MGHIKYSGNAVRQNHGQGAVAIEDDPVVTDRSTPSGGAGPRRMPSTMRRAGLTPRSLLIGLLLTVITDLWVHWAELIVSGGGRGHTALVNTSIPVGPFSMLFALTVVNLICRSVLPSSALSKGEVLVIYVMMTTSCVLSSSGQLHFIVPTVAAAWHYATESNGWSTAFQQFVPGFLAQKNPTVLAGFYNGKTQVPWALWMPQLTFWIGFVLCLCASTFFLVAILRKQWVEREWLSFPTVAVPVALMEEGTPIFKNRLFWIGAALPFFVSVYNCFALNWPIVPPLILRATADRDLGTMLSTPPWNAIGYTPISFYPFVIGIAYLAPVDVTFSCWFFFMVTKVERILGSAFGVQATAGTHAAYPYLGYQGAGAFLALTVVSFWMSRGYLIEVVKKALGRKSELDDSQEPMSYRTALVGLIVALSIMVGLCVHAGMSAVVAITVIVLALMYMIAATRIRAETGNPWLYGPDVDVNTLMTQSFGTHLLGPQDATILAFLRPAIANFDMRCMAMPHQMDAFKMANDVGVSRRQVACAVAVSTVLGVIASWCIALTIWHHFGAEVGTDKWRTGQGRVPFDSLVTLLRNPSGPDTAGLHGLVVGFVVMAGLMICRTQLAWWPFHPFGYAIANTATMDSTWMPFFLAWLFKVCALRYGGSKFYKGSTPFFLGLIAGDLLGGGLFTAAACFSDISAYPINW